MATEKQIAANRRNSKQCIGPKTREGKFESSHNFIVKTEDAAIFGNFSKSYIDEYKPSTPSELENEKPSFARQEAHEIRREACQDRKIRNETNFGINDLSLAA